MLKINKFLILCVVSVLVFVGTPVVMGRENILKKARASFLREEYPQTIRECERLLLSERLDSDSQAELYYLSGVSFLKQNKFSKAKDNLLKVISRYARTEFVDDAYLSLGDVYFLSGDVDNAVRTYRNFLSQYPGSELVHLVYYRLGESYYRLGRWNSARNYWKKVTGKYPQSFEADQAKVLLEQGLYWTVQAAAFVNQGRAKDLRDKLISRKYPAYVSSVSKRSKIFYRVRVGKFDLREQAEIVKRELKKDGFSAQIRP